MKNKIRLLAAAALVLALLIALPSSGLAAGDPFAGCSVHTVKASGDTVTVTWESALDDAELHVQILADADPSAGVGSAEEYTSSVGAKTLSTPGTDGETKTNAFTFSGLPRYYLVKTWFTASAGSSDAVDWSRNTEGIQRVIGYQPSDGVENRYLALGGLVQTALFTAPDAPNTVIGTETGVVASSGSYVLLKEGCVILNESGAMSVTQNGSRYTVSDADAEALALHSGQGICFIDGSGDTVRYLFLKISDVSVAGTTVSFTGVSALDLEQADSIFDGIYLKGAKSFGDHFSTNTEITFETDWTFTFNYEIAIPFLGTPYFDIGADYEFRNGELKLTSSALNIDLPIRAIVLPLADIVTIKAGLFFNISGSASVDINFESRGKTGVILNGFKGSSYREGPFLSFDPVSFDGHLFLGPHIGPELQIGGDFLSVNIGWSVTYGLNIDATLHGGEGGHVGTQSPDWHACKALKCICGNKYLSLIGKIYANIGSIEIKFQPLDKEWPRGDFHYSWTFGHPEKSDKLCPWHGTRLKVTVSGSSGPLSGAKVTYTPVHEHFDEKASCDTDAGGLAIVWPYEGTVTVKAEWTDSSGNVFTGTKDVTMVRGTPQDIAIQLNTSPAQLTFDKNTSAAVTGMPDPVTFYPGLGNVTLPADTPVTSGNNFLGWAKDRSAVSPEYLPGQSVSFGGDTVLYAVWSPIVPTDTWYLIFQQNGGTGAPAPLSAGAAESITVPTGVPQKAGYEFAGWCETPTAQSGDRLWHPGEAFPPKKDSEQKLVPYVLLYAIYTPEQRLVKYDPNTSTPVSNMPQSPAYGYSDTDFTIQADAVPTTSGRRFLGWARRADASAPEYQPGDTFTLGIEDVTLYAVWGLIVDNYYVFYDANGGVNAPLTDTGVVGTPLTLSSETPTREGYVFFGWARSKDADTADYAPGSTYGETENYETVRLYAVWTFSPVTAYVIRFDANGGADAPAPQWGAYGSVVKLSKKTPTRTAHLFFGWTIAGGMPGMTLAPGALVQFDRDVTLVADWTPDYRIIAGAGSGWYRSVGGTLSFTANGELFEFMKLQIDGNDVPDADYEKASGSTIVTLKESYLKTLKNGKHTITFVYGDGRTDPAPFYIGDTVPKTGDSNRPVVLTVLVLCSAAGLILVYKKREA